MATDARERRKNRSREHILTAARELVLEAGAENLSLRKVAERADFSPSSLYEYFESKDDLIRALSERVMLRLDARMATVPATLQPSQRLLRYGLAYVAFAREEPQDFLLFFLHLRTRRTSTAQPAGPRSPYARILEAVKAGLASGALARKGVDAEGIAYGVWAVAHGLAMLQLTHLKGFDADFEAADRAVLEAHLDGLRARG